jgi:hypothetical protein
MKTTLGVRPPTILRSVKEPVWLVTGIEKKSHHNEEEIEMTVKSLVPTKAAANPRAFKTSILSWT